MFLWLINFSLELVSFSSEATVLYFPLFSPNLCRSFPFSAPKSLDKPPTNLSFLESTDCVPNAGLAPNAGAAPFPDALALYLSATECPIFGFGKESIFHHYLMVDHRLSSFPIKVWIAHHRHSFSSCGSDLNVLGS